MHDGCAMSLLTKSRFPKKYVAFFAIVPFLLATAAVKVDCPIDGGTGMVSSAPGMENVVIINTESQWRAASRDLNTCGAYVMYLYDVTLAVVNKGPDDTWGYVKLTLVNLMEGEVVDTQYVVLDIPGEISMDVSYTIWFQSEKDLQLLRSEVGATVIVEDVPDTTCNGTGKISLNNWPLVNALKNTLQELGRQQVYYEPTPEFDPNTEQWTQ